MRFCFFSLLILAGLANADSSSLDHELRQLISSNKLDQPFNPDQKSLGKGDPLVELGGDLFFSPDLSIDGSVACSSCHHPQHAGADGVSLPVGIGGGDFKKVGQERIDTAKATFHNDLAMGLIPRNTPTVINSSLFVENVFWDGRAQYLHDVSGKRKIKTGFGITEVNPTYYEENSLLQSQARMPLTSPFEMKGGLSSYKNNYEIEQDIIGFLGASNYWCERFSKVFEVSGCEQAVTMTHLTRALSAYQASLVFVNSPFERYVRGELSAINDEQKKGAISFLKDKKEGGLGCVSCHSGKIFSSEDFYNLGVPASGLGANDKGWDYGRANVDKARQTMAFKVPGLLNIAETFPYFHNGAAETIADAIAFHAVGKRAEIPLYLVHVQGIDYKRINQAIQQDFMMNKSVVEKLPASISNEQIDQLSAFLKSLTDDCLLSKDCKAGFMREPIVSPRAAAAHGSKAAIMKASAMSVLHKLDKNALPPVSQCSKQPAPVGKGKFFFSEHGQDVGFVHERKLGLVRRGWLMDVVNYAGVSAVDVNNDCLDDLVFDVGEKGVYFYLQDEQGRFRQQPLPFSGVTDQLTSLVMDIDGDYKFDLLVGNLGRVSPYIAYDFMGSNDIVMLDQLTGPVINATAADVDNDGDLDLAFAFWRSFKSFKQNHIWLNDGNGLLVPQEEGLVLRSGDDVKFPSEGVQMRNYEIPMGAHDLTFTPNFVDIDNDGDQDLLMAADFFRSQVFINSKGVFVDATDRNVISDNNGMGAAVGDFNGDGLQDWYVTSVYDEVLPGLTGNRMYMNAGGGNFQRVEKGVLLKKTEWSWGSCAADFNNDGLPDIFYVSGYGEPFQGAQFETDFQQALSGEYVSSYKAYSEPRPRLLINKGQQGFVDVSAQVGMDDALAGRGIACFDYERDGDIDVVVVPLEGPPRLLKNHLDGLANWVQVKLVGAPGNTEAFGATVALHTSMGVQYRQVRLENNYVSRNPATVHFGLGRTEKIDKVVVKFPGVESKEMVLEGLGINQLHIIRQSR